MFFLVCGVCKIERKKAAKIKNMQLQMPNKNLGKKEMKQRSLSNNREEAGMTINNLRSTIEISLQLTIALCADKG